MKVEPLDIATPVLAHRGRGTVRAVTGSAFHIDIDGWIVVVTGPGAPALPNGVRLRRDVLAVEGRAGGWGPLAARARARAAPAELAPGLLQAGPLTVEWVAERPPAWEPRLPRLVPGAATAARAAGILAALGARTPPLARRLRAAPANPGELIGLGPGLTPEGDDLLAGAAAALAACGSPLRLPADLRRRTTALSATLLELASQGAAPSAAHTLVDPARDDWPAALEELCRLGSSTGRAWAAGLAWGLLIAEGAGSTTSHVAHPAHSPLFTLGEPHVRRP